MTATAPHRDCIDRALTVVTAESCAARPVCTVMSLVEGAGDARQLKREGSVTADVVRQLARDALALVERCARR